MQCAPHPPYPHCTEPHCVPLFTPHPASKWQITTTEGGRRWMRMNECSHPPTTTPILPAHPLHLPASPYTTFIPHSLPLLSTAGLCYDCSWCVITHIAVSTAPPWGHPYKGLSFPKVRSEPCTQVLSRHLVWRKEKRKKKLLARTLCLSVCSGHDYWGQCLGCPFCLFFFPPPPLFYPVPSVVPEVSMCSLCVCSQGGGCSYFLVCLCVLEYQRLNVIQQFLSGHYYTH